MERELGGYIKLYRKIRSCKVLQEKNKVFSKEEAWTFILLDLAKGVDDGDVKRGEFVASYRYLATSWRWPVSKTHRFVRALVAEHMLEIVEHQMEHQMEHFKVTNYETYNPQRNTEWNTKRNELKERINKEKEKDLCPPKADACVLLEIFSSENKKLPQVKALTPDRRAKCRSRINQAERTGCLEQYLRDFRAAVAKAQLTPFLCGELGGWRANFDWFISNDRNVYSVLEGKYNSSRKVKAVDQDTVGQYEGPDVEPTQEYLALLKRRAEAMNF